MLTLRDSKNSAKFQEEQMSSADVCRNVHYPIRFWIVITSPHQHPLKCLHFYLVSTEKVNAAFCHSIPSLKHDRTMPFCKQRALSAEIIDSQIPFGTCTPVPSARTWQMLPLLVFNNLIHHLPWGQGFVTPQCSVLWSSLYSTSCPSSWNGNNIWRDQANPPPALREKSLSNYLQAIEDCHESCPLFICSPRPTWVLLSLTHDFWYLQVKGKSYRM